MVSIRIHTVNAAASAVADSFVRTAAKAADIAVEVMSVVVYALVRVIRVIPCSIMD